MLDKYRRLSKTMLIVLIGLSAGAVAVSARQQAGADPVNTKLAIAQTTSPEQKANCQIQASTNNGLTTIKAIFHSDIALAGVYRFTLAGSGGGGNSNISQGGNFSARANDDLILGQMMMGGQAAIYDASLEITANGTSITCENRSKDTA